jgi:Flp pilus assembly protein CpaB
MKKTRVLILGFAMFAAGTAAWLATGLSSNPTVFKSFVNQRKIDTANIPFICSFSVFCEPPTLVI